MTHHYLSNRDRQRLVGVNKKLVEVVTEAYRITPYPLMVIEGVRSEEKQAEYVKIGASRTMNSRHLTGHAVDIGVMDGKELSWHWPLYYRLAIIMRQAAENVGVELRWGGVWDRYMSQFTRPIAEEVALYVARYRRNNSDRHPLIDGPHYELPKDAGYV